MGVLDQMNFNASEVEPATGFKPLPNGEYQVIVDKAEEKPTKRGDGVQMVATLRVVDGQYANRTLFYRINLANPNPKCVEIGRAELSALCRATGVMTPRGVHEFANRLCRVVVTVAERGDGKGLTNEIAKFLPTGGQVAGAVVDGSSKAAQPSAGPAPWAKA